MTRLAPLLLLALAACANTARHERPAAAPWRLEILSTHTLEGLGAIQGATLHHGLLYVYGDADTGIVREYAFDPHSHDPLDWTGRQARFTLDDRDWLPHPTGLAIHPHDSTAWVGDTVRSVGVLHLIDWDLFLSNASLDGALLHTVVDDAASNGTRPEWVRLHDRWVLATSDYGDDDNALRLYDPDALARSPRTTSTGVLISQSPCTPFVQTLEWLNASEELVLVQNTTPGLGYRLTFTTTHLASPAPLDLPQLTDELEGFVWLQGDPHTQGLALLLSSSPTHNAHLVRLTRTP